MTGIIFIGICDNGYIQLILDITVYFKVISKLMLKDANKDTILVEFVFAATGKCHINWIIIENDTEYMLGKYLS